MKEHDSDKGKIWSVRDKRKRVMGGKVQRGEIG